MVFTKALQSIPAASKKRVEDTIRDWEKTTKTCHNTVAENLRAEWLLEEKDFGELLKAFSKNLYSGQEAMQAFEEACKQSKLKGPPMGGIFPTLVGRATTLDRFCGLIVDINSDLGKGTVERLVRRHAISDKTTGSKRIDKAPVGKYVIWSTFKNPDRNETPFQSPLSTKESVKIALGLGGLSIDEPWVLLVYRPQCDQQELRLPTVADAGENPYFQPVPRTPQPEHGWTKPLSPNPDNLAARPEIVHRPNISYKIQLPLVILE